MALRGMENANSIRLAPVTVGHPTAPLGRSPCPVTRLAKAAAKQQNILCRTLSSKPRQILVWLRIGMKRPFPSANSAEHMP